MQSPSVQKSQFFVNPPHRVYSQSELKELAQLIKTYADFNPLMSDAQLGEGVIALGQLYDEALQLRYAVNKKNG